MRDDIESIEKRKKIEKNMRKIIFIIIIILIYNFVLLVISYANITQNFSFFGMKLFVITTESMEPYINQNDIVITKKVKAENIKEGDVITFSKNGKVITHRVVKINNLNDEFSFVTKGDNNTVEDTQEIYFNEIEGKYFIKIPKIGLLIKQIENQILGLVILLVILIIFFLKIQREEKFDKRRMKKNKKNN